MEIITDNLLHLRNHIIIGKPINVGDTIIYKDENLKVLKVDKEKLILLGESGFEIII